MHSKKTWANWNNGEATSPRLCWHHYHKGWSHISTEVVMVGDVESMVWGSARKWWWNKASVTSTANLLSITPDGYHYPVVLDVNNNENQLFMWLEKYMPNTLPCTEWGQKRTLPPDLCKHTSYLVQIKWSRPPNVRAGMLWSKRICCRCFGILNENRIHYKVFGKE